MTPFYKILNIAVLSLVTSIAVGRESGVTMVGVRALPADWTNAPQEAVTHDDWSSHYEVAADLFYIGTNAAWSSLVRGVPVQGVYVLSCGMLDFDRAGDNPVDENTLSVLRGPLSFMPSVGSMFWYYVTDTNSLVLTWMNVFLNRDPAFPVTFQAELWGNGDFALRYALPDGPGNYAPVLEGFRLGVKLGGFGGDEALGDITADTGGGQSPLLDFILANPGGVEVRFKGPDPVPNIFVSPPSYRFEGFGTYDFTLEGAWDLDGTVSWAYGFHAQEGNPVRITPDFDDKPDKVIATFTPAQTNDTYQPVTVTVDVTYKDPPPEEYALDAITFKIPSMSFAKIVSDYQHLGVFTGDSAKFRVITRPSTLKNLDGLLTWGGLAQGVGNTMEVNVPFNTANVTTNPVTVSWNGVTLKANVAIRDQPAGVGEWTFLALPWNAVVAGRLAVHNILILEAVSLSDMTDSEAWAWARATYPGNQINTKADAARHAYWTCLMTRYGSERFTRGLSTAHEVSAPGLANETVMDLHNNAMGIQIAGDHAHVTGQQGVSDFQCCRDAVQRAINDGLLWYMDDPANTEQRGLLQPTNK